MARVVITGGGTGGHVFPMAAVAEALVRLGVRSDEIRFVASRRGQDRQMLAPTGVKVLALPGRGIRRSASLGALFDNAVALVGLAVAFASCLWLILRWRPSVVVSLGGFASVAMDLAAGLTRRRLVLVDLDVVPSASHRLVGRFAHARCGALPSEVRGVTITGAPLRESVENVDRSTARVAGAEQSRWSVVVMTGSLGAKSVNDAVVELAQRWRLRDDLRLVHVTGRRDEQSVRAGHLVEEGDRLVYEIVAFADMAPLWAICDLAVCRAGATTIAELTTLGIPSILIPLPGAPDDHQTRNARVVADAGGALLVPDVELTAQRLGDEIERLLSDPERLGAMARSAALLGHHHAADAIAAVVLGRS